MCYVSHASCSEGERRRLWSAAANESLCLSFSPLSPAYVPGREAGRRARTSCGSAPWHLSIYDVSSVSRVCLFALALARRTQLRTERVLGTSSTLVQTSICRFGMTLCKWAFIMCLDRFVRPFKA